MITIDVHTDLRIGDPCTMKLPKEGWFIGVIVGYYIDVYTGIPGFVGQTKDGDLFLGPADGFRPYNNEVLITEDFPHDKQRKTVPPLISSKY